MFDPAAEKNAAFISRGLVERLRGVAQVRGVSQGRTVMTSASDVLQKSPTRSDAKSLRAKWGWIVALGAVYLFAGFIALGSVLIATVTSVLVVGLAMIVAGVAEVFNAFQIKSWGKCLLWALLGVFCIADGILALEHVRVVG